MVTETTMGLMAFGKRWTKSILRSARAYGLGGVHELGFLEGEDLAADKPRHAYPSEGDERERYDEVVRYAY